MKLYLNEVEQEVPLYTILTPALYDKVSPLLQELANTKGAQTAAESEIMEKVTSCSTSFKYNFILSPS